MRQTLTPLVVSTTLYAFSDAAPANGVATNIRVQLVGAGPDDAAAVFACDDPTRTAGTADKRFAADDPTSWPPGCSLVATVTGAEVKYIPEARWGGGVVVERIAGTTAMHVAISGEGSETTIEVSAPTALGHYVVAFLEWISGPWQVAWAQDADAGDAVELYLTDSANYTDSGTGTGVPADAVLFTTLTGGTDPIEIPHELLATRLIVRRVLGTGAKVLNVTGRSTENTSIVSASPISLVTPNNPLTIEAASMAAQFYGADSIVELFNEDGGTLELGFQILALALSLRFAPIDVGDAPTGGLIGGQAAAQTTDIGSVFRVAQTTAGQTLTLAAPTHESVRCALAVVINKGTQSFTMYGKVVTVNHATLVFFDGTAWVPFI